MVQDRIQARWWMLTIPAHDFTPVLPDPVRYLKGQLETAESGFRHWQIVANMKTKCRLGKLKDTFGATAHCEPTRSEAALAYVWKDDTAVENTRFELGQLPMHKADPKDWDKIYESATRGDLLSIPRDVLCRLYNPLKRIAMDNMTVADMKRCAHTRP